MSAAYAMAAVTAYGVNFVDKNDAGRGFLSLLEHVANARGTDADKHLHKVRAADREKRYVSFTSDGARQQGFASSGRADHQHALGNTATQFLKFLRIAQELDQFLNFILGFLYSGHVAKRDLVFVTGEHARLGLAKVQRPFAGHPDLLAKQKIKDQKEKRDRQETHHCLREHVRFCFDGGLHAGVSELLLQIIGEIQIDGGAEGHRL